MEDDARQLLADALRYKAIHDAGRFPRPGELPAWEELNTEWQARWLGRADVMLAWLRSRDLGIIRVGHPATSAVSSPGPYPKGGL